MDWTQLLPGMAIRQWAMAKPVERHYPGTARPMPDTVDYRFVNGWTQTGDLPCREALQQELDRRKISRPDGPFEDLVLGLDGEEIDFSQFCFQPTLIVRAFRCLIKGKGQGRFRLATCGGVRIWLEDREVAVFEPFQRNTPCETEITMDLTGQLQTLTLRLEDLHERDTTCFFSLCLLAGDGVQTALPKGFSTTEVLSAAAFMSGLRIDGIFHTDGPVHLVADVPPDKPMHLRVTHAAPFSRGGLVADPAAANPIDLLIGPKDRKIPVMQAESAEGGCLSLPLEAQVGKARLYRRLGTTILPTGVRLVGNLAARKRQAADLIAAGRGFEPSVAALLCLRGEQQDRVAQIAAAVLTTIEKRDDCSDFSILPLLRLWRDGRAGLSHDLEQRMRHAFLTYRYWLDEPGDDVMWFWSENHVLCFHTAQLVAGRLFPKTRFQNSGKAGEELAQTAAARLDRWFTSVLEHGLCEWNSAAYYPIDMLGLFTLYDMAPDFRGRARHVLDRIFQMAALHTSGDVPAGTQGRCYEKELLAGPMTELGSIMAIALGHAFRPGYDRASGLFCLSEYTPPSLQDLAVPPKGQWIEARYSQGLDHEGKLTLWKSADGQLSSVTDLKTGQKGHQAQVIDVQLSCHPMARLWINHPGELKPWGERRPSLLAGNHVMPRVAQHRDVALMIYDLQQPWTSLKMTQIFAAPGAIGVPVSAGAWKVFADTVGLWCSIPLVAVSEGLYRDALWRAEGSRMAWIVAMRRPDEDAVTFAKRLKSSEAAFDAHSLCLEVRGLGSDALSLQHDGPLRINGTARPFTPLSPIIHLARNGGPLLPLEGMRP